MLTDINPHKPEFFSIFKNLKLLRGLEAKRFENSCSIVTTHFINKFLLHFKDNCILIICLWCTYLTLYPSIYLSKDTQSYFSCISDSHQLGFLAETDPEASILFSTMGCSLSWSTYSFLPPCSAPFPGDHLQRAQACLVQGPCPGGTSASAPSLPVLFQS